MSEQPSSIQPVPFSEPELLRAYLAGRDIPCSKCGYNLRNLVGRICPECSNPIALRVGDADPLWKYRTLTLWMTGLYSISRLLLVVRHLYYLGTFPGSAGRIAYYVICIIAGLVFFALGLWIWIKLAQNKNVDAMPVSRAAARTLILLLAEILWGLVLGVLSMVMF